MDISDVRQKRLEYFNKLNKSISFDGVLNEKALNDKVEIKKPENSNMNFIDQNNNYSAYVNYNYFNNNDYLKSLIKPKENTSSKINTNFNDYSTDNLFHTSRSSALSFNMEDNNHDTNDDAKQAHDKKINEYKQIIEDTYLNHVVKKAEQQKHDQNLDMFYNKKTFDKERKPSLDTIIVTNRSLSSSLSEYEVLKSSQNGAQVGVFDSSTNEFLVKPCTIQYMSAYNIYEPVEKNVIVQEQVNIPTQQRKQQEEAKLEVDTNNFLSKKPYDYTNSDSSSLSSPIQTKFEKNQNEEFINKNINNNNNSSFKNTENLNLKPRASPRAHLRLYQNSEELNKINQNTTKYNGYSSSTSRSSSSPKSSKPQVQPHPPSTPGNTSARYKPKPPSARIQNNPTFHDIRPPSSQKINNVPNYRKKLINKSNKSVTKAPVVAKEPAQATKKQSTQLYDSITNSTDFISLNSNIDEPISNPAYYTAKDESADEVSLRAVNNYQENYEIKYDKNSKPNSQYQINSQNLVIPDLIQNCLDDRKDSKVVNTPQIHQYDYNKKINEFFEKFDKTPQLQINNKPAPSNLIIQQQQTANQNRARSNSSDSRNDASDSEDTLNILSSRESLNNIDLKELESSSRVNERFKGLNLNINLDGLSDDEDKTSAQNHDNKNNNQFNIQTNGDSYDDDEQFNDFAIENKTQFKQTKPSFIPNLMLDANEDEKSVSVAASLAKSMCTEIDYKKEMEKLVNTEQLTTDNNNNKFVNNPVTSTPNNNNNNNNSNLIKQPSELQEEDKQTDGFFLHLKPPPATKSIQKVVKREPKAPSTLQNSKSVVASVSLDEKKGTTPITKVNLTSELLHDSDSFNKTVEKYQHNLSKINENKNTTTTEKQTPEVRKSVVFKKSENQEKKNLIWESADINSKSNIKLNLFAANRTAKSIQRPKSAAQPNTLNSEKKLDTFADNKGKDSKSNLFDYKKLNEIEINIDNDDKPSENLRPKSSIEMRQKPTIELKFDLSTVNSNLELDVLLIQSQQKPIFDKNIFKSASVFEEFNEDSTNKNNKETYNWCDLPQEIWLNILAYLNHKDLIQFGRCCKLFNQIYSDKILWRAVKMKNRHDVCDAWLNWIGKREPNELSIIQCSGNVSLYTIQEMFRTIGDSLTSLNLSSCFTGPLSGDNVVLQASVRCHNIRHLDLSWTLLSNESLKLIIESFKVIESINLSGCSMVKEDGINHLLMKHGHSLKTLELSGCFHLSPNCILNIGVYCKNLFKLNISNCHRVMNQTIMESSPSWTQLRFLDLRGIKNIKNNCISQLVRKCNMLNGLALANCIHLSDTTVLEIATYKPNFKYIDLRGCKKVTDSAMESISNLLSELEYLDLSATSITDNGLKILCNSKCSKTIDELNLSFLPITEGALIKLIKVAPRLKKLHLYGCYNLKKMSDIKNFINNEHRTNLTICC